ncbi:putative DNA primase [Geobacillus virus E3]|uniref:putative DNA primase n=1 Tax=Geobacillus virus E3 TaxID=1572712 RepID=UPI000671CB83|nr:putative DNA primase [Geobacillus virus E3]AJA41417.1 putative DNA primase [Geobacillus virus E3]
MDANELKERIIIDDKIIDILEALNMHSIRDRGKYITCGMYDGDNPKSTVVYKDNLHVEAYTRNIKDTYGHSDIISLVSFVNNTYFTESIKWICDVCGYDYYGQEIPQSRLATWVRNMWKVAKEGKYDDDEKLTPINEDILHYFGRYGNPLFYKEGISYETQWEFELGYDLYYHMVTIPIRDELGFLVGVKGRLFKEVVEEWESKYFYIQPCAKSKVLYGLHKTKPYILEKKEVIVFEAEKSVMKAWSHGIRNTVAIGSHCLSDTQVQKLTHLGVDIVIAYDEGVEIDPKTGKVDKNFYRKEFDKFLPSQRVYCIYDKSKKILDKKESPIDDIDKWYRLYNEYKFKVRG